MCLNEGEPSSKTKYEALSDSGEYREGLVKSKWLTGEIDPESVVL